ncbi:hypothetical protein L1987_49680 [Smallanthus sonchifolius]|uniref:Uncharacterized protein n=1 Tax=Smallanthus sonchifolius TaxID=185202 RepID=A0ACB9FV66_9ASTR|nr:hypothetical protein L1987_49680 [Smallanthus sonchifolius]
MLLILPSQLSSFRLCGTLGGGVVMVVFKWPEVVVDFFRLYGTLGGGGVVVGVFNWLETIAASGCSCAFVAAISSDSGRNSQDITYNDCKRGNVGCISTCNSTQA